jgi:hypothetical protein
MKQGINKIKFNKIDFKSVLTVVVFCFSFLIANSQSTQMTTYCNPLNVDYTYMIYNAHRDISYRSGADPAVVRFRNEYYMFVTGLWVTGILLIY